MKSDVVGSAVEPELTAVTMNELVTDVGGFAVSGSVWISSAAESVPTGDADVPPEANDCVNPVESVYGSVPVRLP